jgi:hypothetical protein
MDRDRDAASGEEAAHRIRLKGSTMSLKLKALGLAVFAALAVGAVSVVSATADTGGVFHSEVSWTHIKGAQEGTLHQNALIDHGEGDAITCSTVSYTGNTDALTETEITVTGSYSGCKTTNNGYPVTVDMTGCAFVLTIGDAAGLKHHTSHLECATGNEVDVTINPPFVGECHIKIPAQTPTTGGTAYKGITVGGKNALTLDITVEGITSTKTETGFGCLGAPGHTNNSTLKGTVVAEGFNTAGGRVNISATTAAS